MVTVTISLPVSPFCAESLLLRATSNAEVSPVTCFGRLRWTSDDLAHLPFVLPFCRRRLVLSLLAHRARCSSPHKQHNLERETPLHTRPKEKNRQEQKSNKKQIISISTSLSQRNIDDRRVERRREGGGSSPRLRDQSLNADERLEFDVRIFVRHELHDSTSST